MGVQDQYDSLGIYDDKIGPILERRSGGGKFPLAMNPRSRVLNMTETSIMG